MSEDPWPCTSFVLYSLTIKCKNYKVAKLLLVSCFSTHNHLFVFYHVLCSFKPKIANKNIQQRTLPGFITISLYWLWDDQTKVTESSLTKIIPSKHFLKHRSTLCQIAQGKKKLVFELPVLHLPKSHRKDDSTKKYQNSEFQNQRTLKHARSQIRSQGSFPKARQSGKRVTGNEVSAHLRALGKPA